MKIKELLETETPIEISPDEMDVAIQKHSTKGTYLGGGYFGQAFSMPGDVETVDKISRLNLDSWGMDGYYAYVNIVKDIKDETHNPFLPQIHSIKRIEATNGSKYLQVNIEKLYHLHDLDIDEVRRLFEDLIGRELSDNELAEYPIRNYTQENHGWRQLIVYLLKGNLENFKIENPQLIEALKIIKKLQSYGYTEDLHDGNVMVRRTKYGSQLVITDPLAFRNSDKVKTRISFIKDQVGF